MKIGLFGFDFSHYNKGCEALTYSFLAILEEILKGKDIDVLVFTYNNDLGKIPTLYENMNFLHKRVQLKKPGFVCELFSEIAKCDLFFDATFGDGFSDIYGRKWNVKTNLIKQLVIWSKTPLILVPQTYGPFDSTLLKGWAGEIIARAKSVYARDPLSGHYAEQISNREIKESSDMAFKLPYEKSIYKIDTIQTKVGINVSSLLWDGKWVEENHFGLKVNYREYILSLLSSLINDEKYCVHLIPHVIDVRRMDFPENDYRVCKILNNQFGNKIIVAPPFDTPIEAKSYIANMDVFTGARMHSTIGAISTGVATIPFSYSRKFEGLFSSIEYPYIISGKELDTTEALKKTLDYIHNFRKIQQEVTEARGKALKKLDFFISDLQRLIQISIN